MERKLVAILSADVVGYTRMMEIDEAGTLARLKSLRQRLIDPRITQHGGRVVKLMGDGALMEFGSVVAAVECGLAIQHDMASAEPKIQDAQRIRLRIGINVGDVIIEGEDIYGEGVNVAARLQSLCKPGEVAVSAAVRDHVGERLAITFEDIGAHAVKNLNKPVHVFVTRQNSDKAWVDEIMSPSKPAPDKLSIAVLPFVNMSNDAEQEYFVDGVTEDIITALSRFKSLFVIARNSSFRYKGKSSKVQDIGRDLGVHWVVEGSVRKVGSRIRITAQLVDTATGADIWAERYDRTLDDIFQVQDQVVRAIAGAVPGHISRATEMNLSRKPPANLSAFDYLLRGRWLSYHGATAGDQTIEMLTKSIEADPKYALAHAFLANAYSYSIYVRPVDPEVALAKALKHTARAIMLDNSDAEVQSIVGTTYILSGDHARADYHSRCAIELNSNDANVLNERALVLTFLGRHEEAMELFGRAAELDPSISWVNGALLDCLFMQGRYEATLSVIQRSSDLPVYTKLVEAAAHALLGNMDMAHAAVGRFNAAPDPKPNVRVLLDYSVRMCARHEDRDHWMRGFRKAGLEI